MCAVVFDVLVVALKGFCCIHLYFVGLFFRLIQRLSLLYQAIDFLLQRLGFFPRLVQRGGFVFNGGESCFDLRWVFLLTVETKAVGDANDALVLFFVLLLLTIGLFFLVADGAIKGVVGAIGVFAFLFCFVHRFFASVFLFLEWGNDVFEVVGRQ